MITNNETTDARRRRVARRTVLGGMLGAVTSAVAPSFHAYARTNGSPAFGTARSQFTLLDPVKIAPPAQLTRLDGSTTNFAAFRGKVVLVNFWATWCAACRIELPILDRLQEAAGHKSIKVLAISLDRNGRSTVMPFARALKLRHLDIYLDPDGRIGSVGNDNADAFPIYGMPISYVVGPTGRIEGYMTGEADWSSDAAKNLLSYYSNPVPG